MLQDGKNFLNVCNLFIGNKDKRTVEHCFHLIGIGYHVGRGVAAVKLHTFYDRKVGLHGFAFFYSDNAVFTYFFHGFGNEFADFFVICGNSCDLLDGVFVFNGLAYLFEVSNGSLGSFCNTLFDDHRVCSGSDVFETFMDYCLSENASGSGTVAGDVVSLSGNFSY